MVKDEKDVVIFGSHETRLDSAGNSIDVYKFISETEYKFDLWKSQFIATVQCDRVTLSAQALTQEKPSSGKIKSHVVTRIAVDGSFTFGTNFPGINIRLIDPKGTDGKPREFAFTNLGIEFEFDFEIDLSDNNKWTAANFRFYFRPNGMSIDLVNLQQQKDSLLSRLPFKFRKFRVLERRGYRTGGRGLLLVRQSRSRRRRG